MTRSRNAKVLGALCAFAAMLVVPASLADISEVIYHVVVCDSQGCVGVLPIDRTEGSWQPDGSFYWELTSDIDIIGLDANAPKVVATLSATEGDGTWLRIVPPGAGGRDNPQVNVNFAVIAGQEDAEFTITSGLVTFAPIFNPDGQVNVGINLTDRRNDGAYLNSIPPATGKSFSWVNGLPGDVGATMFQELFPQNLTTGPGGSVSDTDDTGGFVPIGYPVSSMSGQISFKLKAFDLSTGSSTFIITPEPATVLMLLGLVLLRRR